MEHAVKLAGILVLTAGPTVLAKEDPNGTVEEDRERARTFENLTPDKGGPVDSGQARTLDLMLMIWTLKTTSSDTE